MRTVFLPLVALFLLTNLALAEDEKVKAELKKLEGKWRLVSIEIEGTVYPSEEENDIVIKGDKATTKDKQEFQLKIDPTTEPKIVDLVSQTGDEKGRVSEGIYKLKDDDLTVCLFGNSDGAKKRPIEFSAKQGSNCILVILKRQK